MNVGLSASLAGEKYLQSVVTAGGITTIESTSIYASVENADADNVRTCPCVIVFATGASEFPHRTGNFNLDLHFKVVASANDTTADDFASMYQEIFDNLNTDTIIADLSSVSGVAFTAHGFFDDVKESNQTIEGEKRVVEMVFPINCCASNIS